MDVKTTFLNGDIEEEFYIEKLYGFAIHAQKSCYHSVCRKGLGSLKSRLKLA
jgi:hypothetical protein